MGDEAALRAASGPGGVHHIDGIAAGRPEGRGRGDRQAPVDGVLDGHRGGPSREHPGRGGQRTRLGAARENHSCSRVGKHELGACRRGLDVKRYVHGSGHDNTQQPDEQFRASWGEQADAVAGAHTKAPQGGGHS